MKGYKKVFRTWVAATFALLATHEAMAVLAAPSFADSLLALAKSIPDKAKDVNWNDVVFAWNRVDAAEKYRLVVSSTSDFSNLTPDHKACDSKKSGYCYTKEVLQTKYFNPTDTIPF